jgi:putative ABC transport system permease protein
MAPPDFPRLQEISLDLRVVGFTTLMVMLTSVVSAILPAIHVSKPDVVNALKESNRSGTDGAARQRLRGTLVAGQIALALILLIGAGLMINSFIRVQRQELGADPANLLTFYFRYTQSETITPYGRYRGMGLWDVNPRPAIMFDRVLDRLKLVPGVLSVAAASRPPLNDIGSLPMGFFIEGRPAPKAESAPTSNYLAVTPAFFSAMRIPLSRGRDFSDRDTASAPWVIIINQTMARRYFPDEDPIGKRITLDFVPDERPREIIGVSGDIVTSRLQREQGAAMYVPHAQQPSRWMGPWWPQRAGLFYVVRASGDPMRLAPAVKRAVAEIDSNTPAADMHLVEQDLDQQVRNLRIYILLLAIFGIVAAVLAATGIYGVMAYSIAQRRREIGIRMALGATSLDVLKMVLRDARRVIGSGLLIGVAGAAALTGVIKSALYGVEPTDPLTFASVSALLILIAFLACVIPTRRAIAVDPTAALRSE